MNKAGVKLELAETTVLLEEETCKTDIQDKLVDYQSMLTEDELIDDNNGGHYVPLRALERLARIKGIERVTPIINRAPSILDMIAVVQIEIKWKDGTISSGCGDAHVANVEGDYALYLTSMAETRARARALRSGLGITICSQEEIAPGKTRKDLGDLKSISAAQITLINKLLIENEMSLETLAEKFPKQFENIITVEDLTQTEALDFIKWLQTGKPRKPARKNKQKPTKD